MLYDHLEQISLSARTIGELDFPPPKIFTNSILDNLEITTLIRDTEPHEQALFTLAPDVAETLSSKSRAGEDSGRSKIRVAMQQRQSSAVSRILGRDMLRQIQRTDRSSGRSHGVDIEILLQGAERLCSVYSVSGALERVNALRKRHSQIKSSINVYEDRLSKQQSRLGHAGASYEEDDSMDLDESPSRAGPSMVSTITEHDIHTEEEAVRELESRKRALEERVADIEKDLGGLLR